MICTSDLRRFSFRHFDLLHGRSGFILQVLDENIQRIQRCFLFERYSLPDLSLEEWALGCEGYAADRSSMGSLLYIKE
jgi:hypothetical protein